MYISTHTPYTLQRESARTHTHTIFRERARAIFREREHTHTIFREGREGRERESTHTQYLEREEREERESTHTQYLQRQERESARTHTPYILQRESARAHTHTIYFTQRARAHTHTYFTREETMHKTFPCAHTHRSHQTKKQHAKCVRLTSASPEGFLVVKD